MTLISDDRDYETSASPPFYARAHSRKTGEYFEGLIEQDRPLPAWVHESSTARFIAPSGAFVDARRDRQRLSYRRIYEWLGDRAWNTTSENALDSHLDLEVWTPKHIGAAIHRHGSNFSIEFSDRSSATIYAAVPNNSHFEAYVINAKEVYLEVLSNDRIIPRGIVDTGLAGAFWDFNNKSNASASYLVARRLVELVLSQPTGARRAVDVVAAAHATVVHQKLLGENGEYILRALDEVDQYKLDALLTKIFVGMALAFIRRSRSDSAFEDIIISFRNIIAGDRPVFGETLRLLNNRFSTMASLVRSVVGAEANHWLDHVRDMLRNSFIGGQAATYVGDQYRGSRYAKAAEARIDANSHSFPAF